jgi:hypothetical protein
MDGPPDPPDLTSLKPGLSYFHVPGDAEVDPDQGFQARGLPTVPKGRYQIVLRNHRKVVAFLDSTKIPELQYAAILTKVADDSNKQPTQAEKFKRVLHTLYLNREGVEPQQAITMPPSAELEELANQVRQFKGYGDAAKFAPHRPTVPLAVESPHLKALLGFLEADTLSPTSHLLKQEPGANRASREPSKVHREVDAEFRRAARTAMGVEAMALSLDAILRNPQLPPETKVFQSGLVLDCFRAEIRLNTQYQLSRAVHQRRNMIQESTCAMPQPDIREAIQRLPLATGPTLVHESSAEVINQTLMVPASRPLQPLRRQDKGYRGAAKYARRPSQFATRSDGKRVHAEADPSGSARARPSTYTAPTRKRTKPAPVAPSASASASKAKGTKTPKKSFQKWKNNKGGGKKSGPPRKGGDPPAQS